MSPSKALVLFCLCSITCLAMGQNETDAVVDAEVTLAGPLNQFTAAVFKQTANKAGNLVISPFSLSTALSMLMLGARSGTASLLASKLKLDQVNVTDGQSVHYLFRDLIEKRVKDDAGFILTNVALLAKSPGLNQTIVHSYMSDLFNLYYAEAEEVDFSDGEKIKDQVNNKVNNLTHGLIPSLLDKAPGTESVFILLNAIYFKQQWLILFEEEDTVKGDFYNNGAVNEVVQKDFMKMRRARFGFQEVTISGQPTQILEMRYKDRKTSMVIVLPNERDGLSKLLSSPSLAEDLTNITKLSKYRLQQVNVRLPKFKIESSYDLKPILIDLGLGSLFTLAADLTGIAGDRSVHLSKVNQKAFINVDEKGTEAAVATVVIGVSRSLVRSYSFVADHPFLFLIRDMDSGLVFFIGKVEKF